MAVVTESAAETEPLRPNKGFHPFLETETPWIFVDACMQGWPDADYGNAHRHGCTAYAVTAWRPHANVEQALEDAMFWHLVARKHPNTLIAYTADHIRQAKREGRAAFILAAQGGDFLDRKLHRLEAFWRLGLRIMLPVYNKNNMIGAGCLDYDTGLTRFGEIFVDDCNRLGIVLDGSHVSKRTTLDMIARSTQPFIFSHSNCRALMDSPRNADDEQIKAVIASGGVMGLAPFGPFVKPIGSKEWPTLDEFMRHVDHVAQLAGNTDHIGIGTDMSLGTYPDHEVDPWGEGAYLNPGGDYGEVVCGNVRSPMRALKDFNSFAHVGRMADKLLSRGYSDEDVHKILGGNMLRVFDQVWKDIR